jgi:hypothetical protein
VSPTAGRLRKSPGHASITRSGIVLPWFLGLAAFLLLAIAAPSVQAGSSPGLSYDLVERPHIDFDSDKPTDDEGAAMFLAMMAAGGLEMQVSCIATLNGLGTPEAAEALASYSRNFVDALMKRGFEREHAIRILTIMGLPRLSSE